MKQISLLINKGENTDLKHFNDFHSFIEYSYYGFYLH